MGETHEFPNNVVLATASYDFDIKLWEPETGVCACTFSHPESQVNAIAISPDGSRLASATHQHVRIYDLNNRSANHIVSYDGLSKNVTTVGYQNQGQWLFTGGEDCTVKIWDNRSHRHVVGRIFQITHPVTCAALHPNQAQLYIGDQSGVIHIWDVKTEHNEQFIPEFNSSIQSLDISSDGKLLAAVTNKGMAYIWRLNSSGDSNLSRPHKLVPKHKMKAHSTYALKVRFSPDCLLMATTSADKSIHIYSTKDFSLMHTLTDTDADQKWVWGAEFSADSTHLFTGSSDQVARLWNLKDGTVLRRYQGHRKAITALAFRDTIVS